MTMHLEKVYINNYGKCKSRLNAKQLRAKQEHETWLRKRGLHSDQIVAKKKANPVRPNPVSDYTHTSRKTIKTSDKVGNGFAKPANVYTGNNLIGIGQMHKSNAVPIFRKEDAIAIAQMRR
jgi:hypothetical protein